MCYQFHTHKFHTETFEHVLPETCKESSEQVVNRSLKLETTQMSTNITIDKYILC